MDVWNWLVVGAVLLLLVWKWRLGHRSAQQLEAISQALTAGAKLVDVRTPMEFQMNHLPNAINIPVADLTPQSAGLGRPSEPVVVYCASGMRSARAVGVLRAGGFSQVHDLGPIRNGGRVRTPVLQA